MTTKTSSKMLPYQKWVFDSICQFSRVKGKHALEIGGVPNHCGIASNLIESGASSVLQINNRPDLPDNLEGSLQYRCLDARNLDLPESSMDLVFSASVLEHLLELDTVLEQLYQVTKPGGLVCLHGGAFWNSALGHHVWVKIDGKRYAFNGENPVPHWSHLYYDRDEMAQYLTDDGLPEHHVKKIVSWIYDSDELNRFTYDDLIDKFNQSAFEILAMVPQEWQIPDEATLDRLYALHGDRISNYTVGAGVVVLRKKNSISANANLTRPAVVKEPADKPVSEPATSAPAQPPKANIQTASPAMPKQATPDSRQGGQLLQNKKACYEKLLPVDGNRFESILEHFYTGLISPGDTVVDVGAHIGRHMLPMANAIGTKGQIFAFEPIPDLNQDLQNKITELGLESVIKLSHCALSNESGTTTFQLIADAPGLSGLKERTSHAGRDIKEIQVQVLRLDDVVPENEIVSFIKIDAEGADFYILNGARRILTQNRPVVGFESGRINAYPAKSYGYSEIEFNQFFESVNYVLYDIVGLKYEPPFWDLPTLNDLIAIPAEQEQRTREFLQLALLKEFAMPK